MNFPASRTQPSAQGPSCRCLGISTTTPQKPGWQCTYACPQLSSYLQLPPPGSCGHQQTSAWVLTMCGMSCGLYPCQRIPYSKQKWQRRRSYSHFADWERDSRELGKVKSFAWGQMTDKYRTGIEFRLLKPKHLAMLTVIDCNSGFWNGSATKFKMWGEMLSDHLSLCAQNVAQHYFINAHDSLETKLLLFPFYGESWGIEKWTNLGEVLQIISQSWDSNSSLVNPKPMPFSLTGSGWLKRQGRC